MRLLALSLLFLLNAQMAQAVTCQGSFLQGDSRALIKALAQRTLNLQDADSALNQRQAKSLGLVVEDAEDMDLEAVLGEKAFYQITADLDGERNYFSEPDELMHYVIRSQNGELVGLVHQVAHNIGGPLQANFKMSQVFYSIQKDGSGVYVQANGQILMDKVESTIKMGKNDPDAQEYTNELSKHGIRVLDAEDIGIHKLMTRAAYKSFTEQRDQLEEVFAAGKPYPYEEMVYVVAGPQGNLVGLVLQFTRVGGPGFKKMLAFVGVENEDAYVKAKATAEM